MIEYHSPSPAATFEEGPRRRAPDGLIASRPYPETCVYGPRKGFSRAARLDYRKRAPSLPRNGAKSSTSQSLANH
jgi:hypothetical protein